MGSKSYYSQSVDPREQKEDDLGDRLPLTGSMGTSSILDRVAAALNIQTAAFLEPSAQHTALHTVVESGLIRADDLRQECSDVLHAYTSISDPAERHRILGMLKQAAKRD